ncbi:MAG: DUF5666 domain-containing protein [Anaerolineales bacterium]|nr:DUF5666 domain-containing protein [Anaerolineales bacterium]
MYKKIVLSLSAALLIAASFSGIAFAAEDDPAGPVKARGEVIAVDPAAGKFRIEKSDGTVLTFFVNDQTHYRGLENLDELQIGWKAGVAAREDQDGKLWAVLVIAGDTSDFIQVRGKITDVNTSAGKYTLERPDGTEMTFFVDENTRYGGQLQGLEDLKVGWQAGVVAKEANPGKLMTMLLIAGDAPELVKAKGVVTSVNASAGKFEIKTPDGRTVQFFVDEKTRYQGQLSSLEDMKVGWQAAAAAKEGDNGKLTAVLVIAGTRPEQVRAQGIIAGVDASAGKFRLEKPDGTVLTFFLDERTQFRGQAENIRDLKEGWRAGVVALEQADGQLLARLVAAGKPRAERPEVDRPLEERPGPDPDIPLVPRPQDTLSFPSNNSKNCKSNYFHPWRKTGLKV